MPMRSLLVVLALAAVIVPGIGHAFWTGRWNVSDEPASSAARLASLPREIEDWESTEQQVDPRQMVKSELAGYLWRDYARRNKSGRLAIFLACGRPGPVSLHTPDICYAAVGFRSQEEPAKMNVELPDSTAEIYSCKFAKQTVTENKEIRIYWSWKAANSNWQAPALPRWTFGGQPVLHKLYVIQPLSGPDKVSDDACLQFIKTLVPEMQKSLFGS
jgi:hypothetical protein